MVLACVASLSAAPIANAQRVPQEPTVVINGVAQAQVKPDALILVLGAEAHGSTAKAAMADNAVIVNRFLTEAKLLGVKPDDLKTTRLDVQRATGPDGKWRYQAVNMVQITLRDVDIADQITAALIDVGANRVVGIKPILKRDDALIAKLRTEAITNAKKAANEAAAAAGVKLGPIIGLQAQHFDWNGPGVQGYARANLMDMNNVPIEPGTIPITVNVTISWQILQ